MGMPSIRVSPHCFPAVARAGFLLLVMVLALLHTSQILHTHRGATAGVYNEEHVLASLESVSGDAPLPDPLSSASALPRSEPRLISSDTSRATSPLRLTHSRAPPAL